MMESLKRINLLEGIDEEMDSVETCVRCHLEEDGLKPLICNHKICVDCWGDPDD